MISKFELVVEIQVFEDVNDCFLDYPIMFDKVKGSWKHSYLCDLKNAGGLRSLRVRNNKRLYK